MTLIQKFTIILLTFTLVGCGGDYDANPVVTGEDDNVIIITDPTTIDPSEAEAYIAEQRSLLESDMWQSGCYDKSIVELEISATDIIRTTYIYSDTDCTELLVNTASVSNESYSLYELVTNASGFNMIRLEIRTAFTNFTFFTRTTFAIVQNRLYFGIDAEDGVTYPTELNYGNPFYPISENQRIELPVVETTVEAVETLEAVESAETVETPETVEFTDLII